jgi:choline dehydrogenase
MSVDPDYLATDYGRKTMVGAIHKIREIVERSPLAEHVDLETTPGENCEVQRR